MGTLVGEISDTRIKKLVRKYRISDFGGCFAKDEIAAKPAGFRYVVNMENHTGGGTHWVLLDTRNPRSFIYFDPFGVIPPTEIVQFARRHHVRLSVNRTDVQSYYSEACGWYCVYMMAQMDKGRSMRNIIHQDFVNLGTMRPRRNNDQVLSRFFA